MALAATVSLPEKSLSNVFHECKAEAEQGPAGGWLYSAALARRAESSARQQAQVIRIAPLQRAHQQIELRQPP
jgi:hypothetical protein